MKLSKVQVIDDNFIQIPESNEKIYTDFEPTTLSVISKHLKEGDVFLDIGANFGFFSVLAASIVKNDGKFFSIEAHPGILPKLEDNLKNFSNVTVIGAAVGAKSGVTEFHMTEDFVNSGVASNPFNQESQKISIPIDTIDNLLSQHGNSKGKVDFIKCDVQGDEVAVLEGCRKLIEQNDNLKMIVEWAPAWMENAGYNSEKFPSFLNSLGFSKITIVDDYLKKEMSLGEMLLEYEKDKTGKRFCNILASK